MDIPPSCRSWASKMQEDDSKAEIVENILREDCVSEDAEELFFDQLREQIELHGDPETPFEAKTYAVNVVDQNRSLLFQGNTVPDESLSVAVRVKSIEKVAKLYPDDYIKDFGYDPRDFDFQGLDWYQVEEFVEGIDSADSAVSFGLESGFNIVWVSDREEVDDSELHDLSILIDRLGLVHLEQKKFAAVFVYEIPAELTLSVPRVFDAVNFAPFSPVDDCDADVGETVPLTPSDYSGLPEAIHDEESISPLLAIAGEIS